MPNSNACQVSSADDLLRRVLACESCPQCGEPARLHAWISNDGTYALGPWMPLGATPGKHCYGVWNLTTKRLLRQLDTAKPIDGACFAKSGAILYYIGSVCCEGKLESKRHERERQRQFELGSVVEVFHNSTERTDPVPRFAQLDEYIGRARYLTLPERVIAAQLSPLRTRVLLHMGRVFGDELCYPRTLEVYDVLSGTLSGGGNIYTTPDRGLWRYWGKLVDSYVSDLHPIVVTARYPTLDGNKGYIRNEYMKELQIGPRFSNFVQLYSYDGVEIRAHAVITNQYFAPHLQPYVVGMYDYRYRDGAIIPENAAGMTCEMWDAPEGVYVRVDSYGRWDIAMSWTRTYLLTREAGSWTVRKLGMR